MSSRTCCLLWVSDWGSEGYSQILTMCDTLCTRKLVLCWGRTSCELSWLTLIVAFSLKTEADSKAALMMNIPEKLLSSFNTWERERESRKTQNTGVITTSKWGSFENTLTFCKLTLSTHHHDVDQSWNESHPLLHVLCHHDLHCQPIGHLWRTYQRRPLPNL